MAASLCSIQVGRNACIQTQVLYYSTLQHTAAHYSTLQYTTVKCTCARHCSRARPRLISAAFSVVAEFDDFPPFPPPSPPPPPPRGIAYLI